MQKSPLTAVMLSAYFPGVGQLYNESFIKAPLIWIGEGLLVWGWLWNHERYLDNKRLFNETNDPRYREIRTFYRDQRDLFAIYITLLYLLNLVDAYVDSHLFDFTVDENMMTGLPLLNMKINF